VLDKKKKTEENWGIWPIRINS